MSTPLPLRPRSAASVTPSRTLLSTVACALALCVALQAVLLTAQHAFGRAHHHLASVAAVLKPWAIFEGTPLFSHRPVRPATGALPGVAALLSTEHLKDTRYSGNASAGREPAQAHRHHHDGVEHHHHDERDAGVVYDAEDDRVASLSKLSTWLQAGHDLVVVMSRVDWAVASNSPQAWPGSMTAAFRSHVTVPPKRPPRG